MTVKERADPFLSFRFKVEIAGKEVGGFSEVSGLEQEFSVESFRQGGENLHERQLVGPAKFPSRLVLKRGIGDVRELWDWYRKVCEGAVERKTVSIELLDESTPACRWSFRDAVPVKWTGPQLRGAASEVAVETLELIHRGFTPQASSVRR